MAYFYKTSIKDNCGFKEPENVPDNITFACTIENDYFVVKTDAKLPLEEYTGDTTIMFPNIPDDYPAPTDDP